MKVLVTGAGGMVGSHMVEFFYQKEGFEVLGTYYKPTTNIHEINPEITLKECDIRYPLGIQKIILEYQPDLIFHLAAQSYPTVSWDCPFETIETNVNGTAAVFEAIKWIRKSKASYDPMVVVACSSAEYGETLNELPEGEVYVKETAELKPLHPYGVSKVGQDLLAFQYWQNDHIRCIRARIFNSTGTRKVNDVTSDFTRRAVEAERTGHYVLRTGNLKTRRAIMDQRDLVRALYLLSLKGRPGEVYNISSEKIYSMNDIVAMIEKELGHELQLETDPSLLRPTDERVIAGDITRLKRDTGWEQEIPMKQTVRDMMRWWRREIGREYEKI